MSRPTDISRWRWAHRGEWHSPTWLELRLEDLIYNPRRGYRIEAEMVNGQRVTFKPKTMSLAS